MGIFDIVFLRILLNFAGPSHFYTKYYLGFTVYVSNTSDMLQGTLCFKDDNFTTDTIPAVFTTTCPGSYSTKVFSDLCEVEVYGGYSFRIKGIIFYLKFN